MTVRNHAGSAGRTSANGRTLQEGCADDGHVINGPAVHRQPCFEARDRAGHIDVRAPEDR